MDSETNFSGQQGNCGDKAIIGILTVSDRASKGEYEDQGGPAILEFFKQAVASELLIHYQCVEDNQQLIEEALIEMSDRKNCSVIVTTGGTGPAQRDVTPEATAKVCDKILDGFGEQMRMISLKYVPTAILSRQIGGIRKSCLIFNLPGRPKAIRETIDEVWRAVPYCVDLIGGPYIDMNDEICNAFRPKDAKRR